MVADFNNLLPCRAGEMNFTRSVKMKKAEVERAVSSIAHSHCHIRMLITGLPVRFCQSLSLSWRSTIAV
jgi:hypothetical protein